MDRKILDRLHGAIEKNRIAFVVLSTVVLVYILYSLFSMKPTGLVTFPVTPLNPASPGIDSSTLNESYDELVDYLFSDDRVVTSIGDVLWVPWYRSSESCDLTDLANMESCSAEGQPIDETHNCMVTDELSQVGLLVSMGNNQTRMDRYYNTLLAIKGTRGDLPAWRIYREGDRIEPCREGINGNCDTASDATARIIISLYNAANNTNFMADAREKYRIHADKLVSDFLAYEVEYSCRDTSLEGYEEICYWLSAGSVARESGPASGDYGYTGYYPDAAIAMLTACSQKGEESFCRIAEDFVLNYLEASKFDGTAFSVPPGRSFRWVNLEGIPVAECTNTCSPIQWDNADAPRAFGICAVNYYGDEIGYRIPILERYCQAWYQQHGQDPTSIPLQYHPDGTASAPSQSGYFAQGLQSFLAIGANQSSSYNESLKSALGHFSKATGTWDSTGCFGIYHPAFAMRSLALGIGRDKPAIVGRK